MILPGKILLYVSLLSLFGYSGPESETFQWTRFRGSGGQGIDTMWSAPVTWESSDFRWEITLPGKGHASPVVWGNRIFVTGADDEKDTGYLMAVDTGNGEILWQKEFDVADLKMHDDNTPASPTPAVDESQVYVIWYTTGKTNLFALDHDGTPRWQAEFGGIEARHGGGSSLVLTDRDVIFTREQEEGSPVKSSWVAVNKRTGHISWELERETCSRNSFSTPILVKNDKKVGQLIFTSQAHGFSAVDPETGEVLWERKELLSHRVVASPVYSEGIIVGCRKGEGVAIEVDLNRFVVSDSALYTLPPNLSPYVPTPIAIGRLLFLFMDNGNIACTDLATGELMWKERPAGAIYGSPILVDGNLYCITKEGEVVVIGADSSYHLLGIHDLGDGSFSTPAMCGSGMVFRTFSKLMILGND